MKLHILNPVRNLLRKLAGPAPQEGECEAAAPPAKRPLAMAPRPEASSSAPVTHHNGHSVELSLQAIAATLPLEIQARIVQPAPAGLTFAVPLEKVLSQLSRGVVQICFGELRQAVPDMFTPENDRDRVLIPLPLSEILPRLNPALITRRRVQKQVEVPVEVLSPFDQRNRCLTVDPSQSAAPTAAPVAAPARRVAPVAPAPMTPPVRGGLTSAPAPQLPGAQPPAATPPPPLPPKMSITEMLEQMPAFQAPAPEPPPPAQNVAPPPAPAAPVAPAVPHKAPVVPAPTPIRPAATPTPAPARNGTEVLVVTLASLAETWPDAVRTELVHLNLVDARVALPGEAIERGLKQGKVAFPWKTLRSWIKPTPLPTVSAHDGAMLELPLKVVAPLFLARQQAAAPAQAKVAIDEEIPNLFFGYPQNEGANAAVATPAAARAKDTNFYVWNDTNDHVRSNESEVKRGPSPGTKFVAKYATPNEVVSRAAALDGVVGALIALPDGLMVASRIPTDLNGDTLAAFLPQIYGKINQCTKELRMGELNNVGFTVGNTPWKIFRVNAIFFAAFGRSGEPLPTSQLAALAAELDHKPK